MTIKESENSAIDYKFISKYIREDPDDNKENSVKDREGQILNEKFSAEKSSATEVLGNVGEGGSFPEKDDSVFHKKPWENKGGYYNKDNEDDEDYGDEEEKVGENYKGDKKSTTPNETIESASGIAKAKKEFLKNVNDESLTLDACERVNKDWGRG